MSEHRGVRAFRARTLGRGLAVMSYDPPILVLLAVSVAIEVKRKPLEPTRVLRWLAGHFRKKNPDIGVPGWIQCESTAEVGRWPRKKSQSGCRGTVELFSHLHPTIHHRILIVGSLQQAPQIPGFKAPPPALQAIHLPARREAPTV